MFSLTPLSRFTLTAEELPDRLIQSERRAHFSLPGADALSGFADLLGAEDESNGEPPEEAEEKALFDVPGMLPADVRGYAELSREIDFGQLCGDRAVLVIDRLCGKGSISLGETTLCRFPQDAPEIQLDLTDWLRLGRKQMLSIRFDDAAGAGVCSCIRLITTHLAYFLPPVLSGDGSTLNVQFRFFTKQTGDFAIRAACVVPGEADETPWRESRVRVHAPGETTAALSFSMRAPRFAAGQPYDTPTLKAELYALDGGRKHGVLLCSLSQMAGHPGRPPRFYVPLEKAECGLPPDELIAKAKTANIHALFLPVRPDALLGRRCTQEGIALITYLPEGAALAPQVASLPCVFPVSAPDSLAFAPLSAAASCRLLCGMPALPVMPGEASDRELLLDASGKNLDPDAPQVQKVMRALSALSVRLRAEAARQGQYAGALCAPGQWQDEAVRDAVCTALAPLHLSALPLRGAWWAQSFFSATLCAFIPESMSSGTYAAEARLLDAQGAVIASLLGDCPVAGGMVGLIEGRLPATACVLTLHLRLLRSGAVVEEQTLPVYVGERGPLEAAFA